MVKNIQFVFSCSSCRWTTNGAGCCYCNPKKHEELAKKKEHRSRALAEALKKGLEDCKKLGIMPEVPEPPKGPAKLSGGGTVCHRYEDTNVNVNVNVIYNLIYIYI